MLPVLMRGPLCVLQRGMLAAFLFCLIRPGPIPNVLRVGDELSWIVLCCLTAAPFILIIVARRDWPRTPLDGFIIVYLLTVFATWPIAFDRYRTSAWIVGLLGNVGLFWTTVYATRRGIVTPRVVLVAFMVGIAVSEAMALNFHLEQGLLARPTVYPQPAGWSGYPELGLLAAIQLAILVAALSAVTSWWQRAAVLILVATNVVELALLFSRLAWVAALGVLLAAALLAWRTRRFVVLIPAFSVMLIVGGLLVAANPTLRHLTGTSAGGESIGEATLSQRLSIWRRTIRMIQDYPLTGVGLGNFTAVYEPHYNPQPNPDGRRGVHAHNLWLHQTAELGVPGGTAYLAIWIAALVIAWRRASSSFVGEAGFYIILAIAVRNVGDNMFFSISGASARLQTLTWICFGLLFQTEDPEASNGASGGT